MTKKSEVVTVNEERKVQEALRQDEILEVSGISLPNTVKANFEPTCTEKSEPDVPEKLKETFDNVPSNNFENSESELSKTKSDLRPPVYKKRRYVGVQYCPDQMKRFCRSPNCFNDERSNSPRERENYPRNHPPIDNNSWWPWNGGPGRLPSPCCPPPLSVQIPPHQPPMLMPSMFNVQCNPTSLGPNNITNHLSPNQHMQLPPLRPPMTNHPMNLPMFPPQLNHPPKPLMRGGNGVIQPWDSGFHNHMGFNFRQAFNNPMSTAPMNNALIMRGNFRRYDLPPADASSRLPPPPEVPPANPRVLEMIKNDNTKFIKIDGIHRDIPLRYYGETGVVLLGWDDPREVQFQNGSRKLIIDQEHAMLILNAPYREFLVSGKIYNIRLGGPTRELYIDGHYYEIPFNGRPINIMVNGIPHTVLLFGPIPKVKIGDQPRTDLVAGKINLVVNGREIFPIYLDAKPQRFDINGIPFILRFVEALQVVVINGTPLKFDYGGSYLPISYNGVIHQLRLSVLPRGIRPGYVSIINMEGGKLTPPPLLEGEKLARPDRSRNYFNQFQNNYGRDESRELSISPMPATNTSSYGVQSYAVETSPEIAPPPPALSLGNINVGELYQKLVASGIVPPSENKDKESEEDEKAVKPVDFTKPDTMKVRQPGLIARLYSGVQCSSCGVRFPPEQTMKYSQHLDWHFRQNRKHKQLYKTRSRGWNYDVSDWVRYKEIEDENDKVLSWFEIQEKNKAKEEELAIVEPSVMVTYFDQEPHICQVCQDEFEQFYDHETEEWHFRNALRVDELLYHPECHQEVLTNRARIDVPSIRGLIMDEEDSEALIIIEDYDLSGTMRHTVTEEVKSSLPPPLFLEEVKKFPMEEEFENLPMEEELENLPMEEGLENLPMKEEVGNLPTEEKVENLPMEEEVENLPMEEEVENLPMKEEVGNLPTEEEVENSPTEEQVENLPMEKEVENLPMEEVVENSLTLNEPEIQDDFDEVKDPTDCITDSDDEFNTPAPTKPPIITSTKPPIIPSVKRKNSLDEIFDAYPLSDLSPVSVEDDDVLHVEVVEQKLETYEIEDDDDNNLKTSPEHSSATKLLRVHELKSDDSDEEIDFRMVKIKKEKVDVMFDPINATQHKPVISTIDGNVDLEGATPVILPKHKIKINISSKHIPPPPMPKKKSSIHEAKKKPPPPRVELIPATLKPRLLGKKLVRGVRVSKDSDVSALCSIM